MVRVSTAEAVAGIVLVIRAFVGGPENRLAVDVSNGKIAVAREACDVGPCRDPRGSSWSTRWKGRP
jgi:hypothetical protein